MVSSGPPNPAHETPLPPQCRCPHGEQGAFAQRPRHQSTGQKRLTLSAASDLEGSLSHGHAKHAAPASSILGPLGPDFDLDCRLCVWLGQSRSHICADSSRHHSSAQQSQGGALPAPGRARLSV